MANVLVIGGGGREHALCWSLRKSPQVKDLFCAPGNAGIEAVAACVPLNVSDPSAVLAFLKEKKIDLTVIGPEAPLVEGLSDAIRAAGGRVFGPSRAAAQLEGSKAFAKDFMRRHGLPTADFHTFREARAALDFIDSPRWDGRFLVVKADGLAAGKGVTVAKDRAEARAAVEAAMVRKVFGAAGETVVLEETLSGEELSVIALCDGETIRPLAPSQDHKRVFDDDRGPNTGGMGAYAPVPRADAALLDRVEREVFSPFLKGLAADKLLFRGVIYFGLMLTPEGPKLLEFNVRFGDPETQVVVPLLDGDAYEILGAAADGRLKDVSIRQKSGAAATIVLASGGYPGAFEKGKTITGLEAAAAKPDVAVFHAGTTRGADGSIRTAGGRVLAVTALGADLSTAVKKAYEAAALIRFDGVHYRKDIAARALKPAKVS